MTAPTPPAAGVTAPLSAKAYLYFDGRTEEALNFYQQAIGAQVDCLMRFKDNPGPTNPDLPPGSENKVMHATFRIGDTSVMASDGMCQGKSKFDGISLAIYAANVADAERLFANLQQGGQVQMPLTETFFSPRFGMVADKFGVSWMVLVQQSS